MWLEPTVYVTSPLPMENPFHFWMDFPMNQGLAETWRVDRKHLEANLRLLATPHRQVSFEPVVGSVVTKWWHVFLSLMIPYLYIYQQMFHGNLQRLLRSPSWDWGDSQIGFNCFCFKLTISCVADETSKSPKMMYDLLSLHIMYYVCIYMYV